MITDFNSAEDLIQLSGVAGDYNLGAVDVDGVGIYRESELVAVVQNASQFELTDTSVIYI